MAGLLYVTMHPKPSLPPSHFHDWYNNEHGPLRLRLPFISNGFRYRATDALTPEWVALYDVTDMTELTKETYLALREDGIKTPREKAAMAQIDVGRRLYDQLSDQKVDGYVPLEEQPDADADGAVLIAVSYSLSDASKLDEVEKWYRDEHLPMLSRVPGWRRSRRFVTSVIDSNAPREYVNLYEYSAKNGLGGPEHLAAMNTSWGTQVKSELMANKARRVYQWYYTFGPAPRELHSLAEKDNIANPWNSNDQRTRTLPSTTAPAVESFITTADGADIPYRLEGSTNPRAPVIVLSNSILVDYSIWDGFVESFLANPANSHYRILRYQTRGRFSQAGEKDANIDLLASDIIALLDALRVDKASLIGVSLGGVTVLNTALLYPNRVSRFIACDTNSSAPESNRKAWNDRVVMAEKDNAVSSTTNEPIIGESLAEVTTRRWFIEESYQTQPDVPAKVKEIVRTNSLVGFRKAKDALCAYDVRDRMANASVPGLFVAGAGDGVLPQTMQQMAKDLKGGAELKIVEKAGHLPMVEQPAAFIQAIQSFLS